MYVHEGKMRRQSKVISLLANVFNGMFSRFRYTFENSIGLYMKRLLSFSLLLALTAMVISCSSSRRGIGCPGNPQYNYRGR
jgi:hypothetical protein